MATDGSSKLPALLLSVLMATISISASLPSWDFSILETKDTKQSVASNSSIDITSGHPVTIQTTLTGNSSSGTYDFDSNSTGMYFTSESIDSQGKVAVGDRSICAIFADNKLKCWGWNLYGQLGIGSNTDQNTPQTVDSLIGQEQFKGEILGTPITTTQGLNYTFTVCRFYNIKTILI